MHSSCSGERDSSGHFGVTSRSRQTGRSTWSARFKASKRAIFAFCRDSKVRKAAQPKGSGDSRSAGSARTAGRAPARLRSKGEALWGYQQQARAALSLLLTAASSKTAQRTRIIALFFSLLFFPFLYFTLIYFTLFYFRVQLYLFLRINYSSPLKINK